MMGPLIEGTSLACLRRALAVELAGPIEALRAGDVGEAAARLTSWLRDTAAAHDHETWAAAPAREHERWQESHTITALSRQWMEPHALAVPAAALCEILETIAAAAGALGWWSELQGEAVNLTDEPGAIDHARGLLRAAAEEGTIAADEVRFWRQVAGGLAARQRDAFDRLTRSLVEQTSRASELAGQLLQATAERGPLEAERRALRHLAGFFGVAEEEDVAREIARSHTEALRELAQITAERDRALARLGEIGEERDRLADELARYGGGR